MSDEIWKPVIGYEDLYHVSSQGRVKSTRPRGDHRGGSITASENGLLSLGSSHDGYLLCVLYDHSGQRRTRRVHVLVLESFVGPRPGGMVGGHLNAIRDDNRIENLVWITPQENVNQRSMDGNTAFGEKHGRAKVTEDDVRTIRSLRGKVSQSQLARQFGLSCTSICFIQSGRNWSHVK